MFQTDQSFSGQHQQHLLEDFFKTVFKFVAPKPVDGIVVDNGHSSQPHKIDVLTERKFYFTGRTHIGHIDIQHYF